MLMKRMGAKTMRIDLQQPISRIPETLAIYDLRLGAGGDELFYTYNTRGERTGITRLLTDINGAGLGLRDVQTSQSSLEDIFVDLVKG